MNKEKYDVVVIAEGLNSLLSAYVLTQLGTSIAVIDNYKPSFEVDGYIFDTYPGYVFSINNVPGVFKELAIPFETYITPALQIILPDRRIDIYSNEKRCILEIKRRFGEQSSDKIIKYLLKEKKIINLLLTINSYVSQSSHTFNTLIKHLHTKYILTKERHNISNLYKEISNDDIASVFIMALQKHLFPWGDEKLLYGVPIILQKRLYPIGGKSAIKSAIIDVLAKHNIPIIQNKTITDISYKKDFTISLDHNEQINSKYIVVESLYEKTMSKVTKSVGINIKKRFYVDNIFVGMHRICLPEGYNRSNCSAIISDYKMPLCNDNLIFVFNNPISDIKRAKDEMTALTISYLIPDNSISRLSKIRNSILSHIKEFMPFFEDFTENIYFTEPYILWDNQTVHLNKKRIWLLNDEFLNSFTFDEKYAYIVKRIKKLVSQF